MKRKTAMLKTYCAFTVTTFNNLEGDIMNGKSHKVSCLDGLRHPFHIANYKRNLGIVSKYRYFLREKLWISLYSSQSIGLEH